MSRSWRLRADAGAIARSIAALAICAALDSASAQFGIDAGREGMSPSFRRESPAHRFDGRHRDGVRRH